MATAHLLTSATNQYTTTPILDSGANNIFFPMYDSHYMSNYESFSDPIYLYTASKQPLRISGQAYLGPFKAYIVPHLSQPLISESYLVKNFKIMIIRIKNHTFILDSHKILNAINPKDTIIASAYLSDDGLYHLTNLLDLVQSNPQPMPIHNVHFANQITTTPTIPALTRGRYQGRFTHLLQSLNPLEVLKVRLGFSNIKHIRDLVRLQAVNGLGVTNDQIKSFQLSKSLAEYQGNMHAFPIYPTLSNNIHKGLGETWSLDPVPMPLKSIEGYHGYYSFVESSIKFRLAIGYKSDTATNLVHACDILLKLYGHQSLPHVKPLRVIILDSATTHLSQEFSEWCNNPPSPNPIVHRHTSAPYKHQQNLIEPHIGHEKTFLRTNLAYNKAPPFLWYKALNYSHDNINLTIVPGTKMTRQEALTKVKPDVSSYVPFYSTGYAFNPKELRDNSLSPRAIEVKMVGYGHHLDPHERLNVSYKNSFQCYIPPNKIIIRHDVIWEHLSPSPSLLNSNTKQRFSETFESEEDLMQILNNTFQNTTESPHSTTTPEQSAPDIITYDTPQIQPAYTDENPVDLTQPIPNGPITRSYYEPNYWVSNLLHSNQLLSPIFHDNPTPSNTSSDRHIDDSIQSSITCNTPTEHHQNDSTPHSIPPNTTHESPQDYSTHTRQTWLKSLFPSYIHSDHIQNANLVNTNPSTLLIQSDGTLQASNQPIETQYINDLFHDYNRVIRQILTDDHKQNQLNFYNPNPSSKQTDSYYVHPDKRNRKLRDINSTQLPQYYNHNFKAHHTEMQEAVYNPEPSLNSPSLTPVPIFHLPLTLEQALNGPDRQQWHQAWLEEMHKLEARSTWRPADSIPTNQKPIKSKYVFKIKVNRDQTLRYKVRLCACGYSQKYGIDYDETFAPTAKYKSLCTILTIAASQQWILSGIDVENAFVEAEIDRPIYMHLPTGTYKNSDGTPVTVELLRSLYGLKQAPELWDKFLVSAIKSQNFHQLMHDQCIFIKHDDNGNTVIIIKYVDDIIITSNSQLLINEVMASFDKAFTKLTHEPKLSRYVGLDIDYDISAGTIRLSQKPFIQKVLQKYNISPQEIITPTNHPPLNPKIDYRTHGDNTLPPMRDLTGNLRFLADRTLPNILSACSLLSSHAHNPTSQHIAGGEHILKYLNEHQNDHITLGGDPHITLFGYADAAHVMPYDSKSQLGYCFYLNETSGAVVAKSKRDTTISHSSTEAEIKALDLAIREATWFRGFLYELGYPQTQPTIIYTDNKAATILADTNNISDLTGHLVLRINYIHQEQQNNNIKLKWINTENNVADILTKPLPFKLHYDHSKTLMHGHDGNSPSPATETARTKTRKRKLLKIKSKC